MHYIDQAKQDDSVTNALELMLDDIIIRRQLYIDYITQ